MLFRGNNNKKKVTINGTNALLRTSLARGVYQ